MSVSSVMSKNIRVGRSEKSFFLFLIFFLARRDECPESYCRTPGVGVRVRVHKNFNLAHNP